MSSYWFASKWSHKHLKNIVIGFWNAFLCKIHVILFLFIVCVITQRGSIFSASPPPGNNQFFNRRKKFRKVLLWYYLFSSGIVRVSKICFILGLLVCLIQLSSCWWYAVYNQFSLTIITHFFILPIEFTMMHLGQLHCRVFNFIRCWSLKIAKRFSVANNCEKTKQNTKWKQVREKKCEKQNSTDKR